MVRITAVFEYRFVTPDWRPPAPARWVRFRPVPVERKDEKVRLLRGLWGDVATPEGPTVDIGLTEYELWKPIIQRSHDHLLSRNVPAATTAPRTWSPERTMLVFAECS